MKKVRKKYETKSAKIQSTKKVRNEIDEYKVRDEIGQNPKYEKSTKNIQSTRKVWKKYAVRRKYEKHTNQA